MNDIGDNSKHSVAADQLRNYIERIERLEEEKHDITVDISEVYKELKSNGFDAKTVKTIVKLRKKEEYERQEEEALVETYKAALGMV